MHALWDYCCLTWLTCCLWMTTTVGPVLTQTADSEKCTYISMRQSIESQAEKKLKAMNEIECEASVTEPHSVDCKTHDGRTKMMKLECFCARKTNDMDCQTSLKVLHCCKYENVVCLNGGKLNKTESDCSGKRTPIYKCICPPVLGVESYSYQGERCQNIPEIRECVYKDSVNNILSSCDDDENGVSHSCNHKVNDAHYECGPARQNIDGMVYKKCGRHHNQPAITGEHNQQAITGCQSSETTVLFRILIVVCVICVIEGGVIILCCVKNHRSKNKNLRRQTTLELDSFQEVDYDDDNTDDDGEVRRPGPERRPFLRRSHSVPVP